MAIGTAALVLILSIYNGFDKIIKDNISDLDPELLLVSPDGSKHFYPDETALEELAKDPRVKFICDVMEDNVFISYDERQGLARAKGVDRLYEASNALSGHVVEGVFSLHHGETLQAAVGAGLAAGMGIHPRFLSLLTIWYPDRKETISMRNPAASLHSCKLKPSCLLSVSADVDAEIIVVPIEAMRALLDSKPGPDGLSEEVTGVEVRLMESGDRYVRSFIRDNQNLFAGNFTVLTRYLQHPGLYKMMKYEKFAIFMILIFIVIIVALNIFGSLSMLIIEKNDDIGTLKALGASENTVRKIFITEGWLISFLGMLCGLAAGIALALVQQRFGLIKMPGNFALNAYPVVLKLSDVIATLAGVSVIGFVTAIAAARRKDFADV